MTFGSVGGCRMAVRRRSLAWSWLSCSRGSWGLTVSTRRSFHEKACVCR